MTENQEKTFSLLRGQKLANDADGAQMQLKYAEKLKSELACVDYS